MIWPMPWACPPRSCISDLSPDALVLTAPMTVMTRSTRSAPVAASVLAFWAVAAASPAFLATSMMVEFICSMALATSVVRERCSSMPWVDWVIWAAI